MPRRSSRGRSWRSRRTPAPCSRPRAAALGAHESILQRSAAHAGLSTRAAGVVARGAACLPAPHAVAAARAAAGAGPTGGDGPPCVYLRLPAEAGPQACARGLYARVDEGVYRRVSQEPPEAFQDSRTSSGAAWRAAARSWLVGSRPARDAAGLASGYDARGGAGGRPRALVHHARRRDRRPRGRPGRGARARRRPRSRRRRS